MTIEHDTVPTTDADRRLQALGRVHEQFPGIAHDEAMRIAEWMVSGSVLLDPVRVDRAARALAPLLNTNYSVPDYAAQMRGYVQQILVSYHDDAADSA